MSISFKEQFQAARLKSVPILVVRTFDPASATQLIIDSLKEPGASALIAWDMAHGFRGINQKGNNVAKQIATASAVATKALDMIEGLQEGIDAIIMWHNAHLVWNEMGTIQGGIIQRIWNVRDHFTATGNMLVLFVSPGTIVPAELKNDVLVMDEPLPTEAELAQLIKNEFEYANCKPPKQEVVDKGVRALIGLPAFPSKQSTAMCLDNKTGTLNIKNLWDRKRKLVAQTPGCSIHEGNETLDDVRGLKNIVNFLKDRMNGKNPPQCLLFQDEVEKMFAGSGTDLSGVKSELTGSYCTWFEEQEAEGVTMIGIPGTSKTGLGKALAGEFGIPLVMYNTAAMQSGIIGSTGENQRSAQAMISAIANKRLLVLSTCNGWENLPPEIRSRLGSLGVFFFENPTDEEQLSIWQLWRKKCNIPDSYTLPNCKGWTGREIKMCCKRAETFGWTLEKAANYVVPVNVSSAEQLQELRLKSSGKFLSASYEGIYTCDPEGKCEVSAPEVMTKGRKVRSA